jgi:hypothetical protein
MNVFLRTRIQSTECFFVVVKIVCKWLEIRSSSYARWRKKRDTVTKNHFALAENGALVPLTYP